MSKEELLRHRMLKYRSIGGFQEGIPVDPNIKINMKPSEINMPKMDDIESELENLKKSIIEAKELSDPVTIKSIEHLKQDIDEEITHAFISMGLHDKLESVMLELSKSSKFLSDQPLNPTLKEKVDKIVEEFNGKLSQPGAYLDLKQKLEKLNSVNRVIELKQKSQQLKMEVNQKIPAELKAKMELLQDSQERINRGEPISKGLIEEVNNVKKELMEVLKSADLEIVGVAKKNVAREAPAELKENILKLNKEIYEEIDRVVDKTGVSERIEKLKEDITKGLSPKDIEKMEEEIKETILSTLDITALREKIENLRTELTSSEETVSGDKIGNENSTF